MLIFWVNIIMIVKLKLQYFDFGLNNCFLISEKEAKSELSMKMPETRERSPNSRQTKRTHSTSERESESSTSKSQPAPVQVGNSTLILLDFLTG